MLKRKKLLFKIVCLVLTAIAAIWVISSLPGPGMVLQFRQVQTFNRVAEFATSFAGMGKYQYDIYGRDEKYKDKILSFYFEPNWHGGRRKAIDNRPDRQRHYSVTSKDLFEYSNEGRVLRRIPLSAFGLDSEKHKFFCTGVLEVSDEKIWLGFYKLSTDTWSTFPKANKRRYNPDSPNTIVQWRPIDPPANRIVVDVRNTIVNSIAIDPANEFAFVFSCFQMGGGIYDITQQQYVKKFLQKGIYTRPDFDHKKGILLSDYMANAIAIFDPKTCITRKIAKGKNASWGPDGKVYFTKGATQLWRCNPDGTNNEPVFLSTRFPRKAKLLGFDDLTFGIDRAFFVYYYSAPKFLFGEKYGVLFVDLEEKEYRHIPTSVPYLVLLGAEQLIWNMQLEKQAELDALGL